MAILAQKLYKRIFFVCTTIRFVVYFLIGFWHRSGMRISVYLRESRKLMRYYWSHRTPAVTTQLKTFFLTDLELVSDRLQLDERPTSPVVLVGVKDEIDRMQLFFEHYRALGVHQFVVIDNNSTDGTRDFVSAQNDTRVYRVHDSFQTQKKVAWIEKLMTITGYGRWYVVVDSDELLDFVGSETHTIEDLIVSRPESGKDYMQGFLVDMYAENPVFSVSCNYQEIPQVFQLFDKDSYYREGPIFVYGGPRHRVFGVSILLTKQSVFLFKPETIYCCPHYLYGYDKKTCDGFSYILRHYKFLEKDRLSYQERVNRKGFHKNSLEYKVIMDQVKSSSDVSFVYPGSARYENSESLRVLPFLTCMGWDSQNQSAV